MNEQTQIIKNKAFLVGLNTGSSADEFEHSMEELQELTKACNMDIAGIFTQNLPTPITATYIGSGKITEIREAIAIHEVDTVIFDETLSRQMSSVFPGGKIFHPLLPNFYFFTCG